MYHSSEAAQTPVNKSSYRKRNHKSLTYRGKLSISDELDRGEITPAVVNAKHNLHPNTLRNWGKTRGEIQKIAEEERQSERKRARAQHDGLSRIRSGLKDFYAENNARPDGLKIPLTRKFVLLLL